MAGGTAAAALTMVGAFMMAIAANADKLADAATGVFIAVPSDLGSMIRHPDAI